MAVLRNFLHRLIGKYLENHPPRWIIFLFDIIIGLLSLLLAFYIRFNFRIDSLLVWPFEIIIPVYLFCRILTYSILKLNIGLIRYSSVKDLERVLFVNFSGTVLLLVFSYSFRAIEGGGQNLIPLSVIIMEYLIVSILMITARLLIKTIFFEISSKGKKPSKVLVYGVGELANLTVKAIENNSRLSSKVVALINPYGNDQRCIGTKMDGLKVYTEKDIESLKRTSGADRLIIASDNIDLKTRERLIEICSDYHIKVLTVPIAENWIDGNLSVNEFRELRIEDLLERPVINLDRTAVEKEIAGKVVLITGAAGSIGSELVRQICDLKPKNVVLYDQAETPLHSLMLELRESKICNNFEIALGDIANEFRLDYIFRTYKPEFVFHAAAYKHVPMLEDNPKEAMRTNVYGTKLLADLSRKFGVDKFVMISTDKAVNPTNVMGASKRISEMYIQSLSNLKGHRTNFITTRFGNVLGSNGSVVELFRKQIENGKNLTVTHPDMQRYFMTIPEAVQLVLEASVMGKGGEIFVFDMGEMVKIKDLANKMIRLAGLIPDTDIKIEYTGLRGGERLYEVLLADTENLLKTHHPKIMKAKVMQVNHTQLEDRFKQIYHSLHLLTKEEVVVFMKEIVPEFKSENSEYEKIDIEIEHQNAD